MCIIGIPIAVAKAACRIIIPYDHGLAGHGDRLDVRMAAVELTTRSRFPKAQASCELMPVSSVDSDGERLGTMMI